MYCSNCGNAIKPGMKFCVGCGSAIAQNVAAQSSCSGCGTTLPAGSKFCANCGAGRFGSVPAVIIAPPKTIKQQANDTTELIARVGWNFLVGWVAFRVGIAVILMLAVMLLVRPFMYFLFHSH
jgi:hypothetical protein